MYMFILLLYRGYEMAIGRLMRARVGAFGIPDSCSDPHTQLTATMYPIGSCTPASAKPLRRRIQLSQMPQANSFPS